MTPLTALGRLPWAIPMPYLRLSETVVPDRPEEFIHVAAKLALWQNIQAPVRSWACPALQSIPTPAPGSVCSLLTVPMLAVFTQEAATTCNLLLSRVNRCSLLTTRCKLSYPTKEISTLTWLVEMTLPPSLAHTRGLRTVLANRESRVTEALGWLRLPVSPFAVRCGLPRRKSVRSSLVCRLISSVVKLVLRAAPRTAAMTRPVSRTRVLTLLLPLRMPLRFPRIMLARHRVSIPVVLVALTGVADPWVLGTLVSLWPSVPPTIRLHRLGQSTGVSFHCPSPPQCQSSGYLTIGTPY